MPTQIITKALTFRASSIGDCLMGKYLLENIHAAFPDARCGIVVASRGAMIRSLLAAYPWIEVIEANRRNPRAVFALIQRFWKSDFVCTLYTNGRVGILTKLMARFLARRGALVGYTDRSSLNRLIYDKLISLNTDRSRSPRLLEHDALVAAHIPVARAWMTLDYVPQPDILPRLGLQKGSYIVVGLFSGADARGLSPEHKQDLIDALARHVPQAPLVFTGTDKERAQLESMRLPQGNVLAGTSVQELIALIDESAGVVSVGTGTSHIASILRKPTMVLAPCQGMQWVGADQYGDAPVRIFSCPEMCENGHDYSGYGKCLNAIGMDAVAAAAAAFVTKARKA